jgi:hypothetical protein
MSTYQLAKQREGRARPLPVQSWDAQLVTQLKDDFREFLQLDVAGSTVRTYASHEGQYRLMCRAMGAEEAPTPEMLARFVATNRALPTMVGRACNNYKISTIELGVAAVARWAMEEGQEGLASHPLVRRQVQATHVWRLSRRRWRSS